MLNTVLSSNMLFYTNALSLLDKHVCGAVEAWRKVELLIVLQSSMLMWFIFSIKHDTLVTLTISRVISQLSQPSMEYLLVV